MVKKLRKAIRIYKNEGLYSLRREFWLAAKRPWRRLRERAAWAFLLFRTRNGTLAVTANEQELRLSKADKGISRELAIYGVHEPLSTKIMKNIITQGMTVVDIGANIGYYALLEASLVGPTGKVVAIEPSPENIKLLEVNIEQNSADNIDVMEGAVGNLDGVGELHLHEASNWNSFVPIPWLDPTGSVEVETTRIDSLVEKLGISVSLIRMDIEGFETEALEGMMHTLRTQNPYLVIELHTWLIGPEAICNLLRTLKELGYELICAIDREKDYPWSAKDHDIESLSIDLLIDTNGKIVRENKQFMAFLQKGDNAVESADAFITATAADVADRSPCSVLDSLTK